MKIRKAKISEIEKIKKLIDSFEEMDTIDETYSIDYYKRILKNHILLVSAEKDEIIGVCFGTYNTKERWADLLGMVVNKNFRKKGIGSLLVKEFEDICKKNKLKTIDLYANIKQKKLFEKLKYKKGETLIAFRKQLK